MAPDGRIILARDLDLITGRPLRLDLTALKALPADFPWRANVREGRTAKGLLRTNRGILMLVAAPVLDGYGHGPARGMVLMGRLLTDAVVADIGSQAQSELMMLPPAAGAPREVLEETDGLTRVFALLRRYLRPAHHEAATRRAARDHHARPGGGELRLRVPDGRGGDRGACCWCWCSTA